MTMEKDGDGKSAAAAAGTDVIDVNGIHLRLNAKKNGVAGPIATNLPGATAVAEPTSAEHFARSVALMSVAHVARGVGFEAVQRSAGDALVEILAKYIQRIGVSAKEVAEHAGRTQPRATDVTLALHDMLPAPVELTDLIKALETAKRPFPRDIPAFPAHKRDLPGAAQLEQTKIGSREDLPPHVPSFLPPLPNRHTYSAESRVVVEREREPKRTRVDLLTAKSEVQQSLHGLQTVFGQMASTMVPQTSWNAFQGAASDQSSSNPFIQPPVVKGAPSPASKKSVFGGADRDFAPALNRDKNQKKNTLDGPSGSISKLPSSQELGKEERILMGKFYEGDSD
ncbi:hypothetical protein Poli38472_010361 [Pythium oligandrum]|uniref:Transcription initiation factor TFIID subunit 8 n=1 Tax=Pythium oligandrum TaxID=41045 RepID=A0A8K1C2W3_PYTOL|nr:hypothetical protein Poli38472_010361 [Pythium oligandrum]|eukprot:TMW55479.1 hypothetical protein Poli38472_010361 [Pythium oligandrum]